MKEYINDSGGWIEDKVRRDFLAYEANDILDTRIVPEGELDHRFWKPHPKGKYTVSSGYLLKIETIEKSENNDKPGTSHPNCE